MSRTTRVYFCLIAVLLSLPLLAAPPDPRAHEELVADAERIGRLHNEMLDVVASSGLIEKGDLGAMLELVNRHLSEKLGGKFDEREALALVERSGDADAVERELDERQRQLLDTLRQQVETSPSAEVMIRRLRAFENALLRRGDLTVDQKRPLLVGAVVARYSAGYWSEAVADPKSAWNRILNEGGGPAGMPKWVGADLAGALLASEALAPIGVACPPCYVVGVVAVAAGASVAAALG